ncbi:hypothetical protein [Leeuwenhoekiella marinoflava]|uniref:HEPN domain-containing protein n=2 Tax=Leeuwenhoekiella marinoflava TaxID=988 RepID=A0A4V1KS81_9FLAO|nr:hypothetical protein [Leeuwenhoekiella marinoflava]RXG28372.1 hypothetical protein DSL99_2373 [Leeuwenhoekiella marinoflava]SHF50240.1 hypothetical protein SAMN02745246_02664 [Leeuwenhoekiella marinoflava DSM 3653]
MRTPPSISPEIHKVLPIIRSLIGIHTVYLIGQQKITRDCLYSSSLNRTRKPHSSYVATMLIISHDQVADPKIFMNEVFNKTQEQVTLYSVHFTLNEANNRINYGSNFLNRVLEVGTLLYSEDNRLKQLGSYLYHPEVFLRIQKHWNKRLRHACYFEEKSTICEDNPSNQGRYLLLQQSIQQACLGLIYVFWEYQPSYYSLPYLLHLCEQFSEVPKIIYPKRSFRSQLMYSRLCHAQYNLNEKIHEDLTESDSLKAEHLAYKFIQAARKEANKKLEELKELHNLKEEQYEK